MVEEVHLEPLLQGETESTRANYIMYIHVYIGCNMCTYMYIHVRNLIVQMNTVESQVYIIHVHACVHYT